MKKFLLSALMMLAATAGWADALSDYGVITEQPAGELKTYDRSGYAYYVVNDYVRRGAQTGTMDVVFADNNEVYIKDPLSKLIVNTWVKGTLSEDGTTITLPMGQNIQYDTEAEQPIAIKMMEYDEDYDEMTILSTAQVTYTISEDKITLNGTGKYLCMGAVWATSNEWAGFADYSSVYTPAITDVLVEVPEGLETDVFKFKGSEYQGGELNYNTNVGVDGNELDAADALFDHAVDSVGAATADAHDLNDGEVVAGDVVVVHGSSLWGFSDPAWSPSPPCGRSAFGSCLTFSSPVVGSQPCRTNDGHCMPLRETRKTLNLRLTPMSALKRVIFTHRFEIRQQKCGECENRR